MRLAYLINVTLHVLAAVFWLGGMFFLGLVGAPVLRAVEPPELRKRLFNQLGVRFRFAGWVAIAILVATGLLNAWFRGWLQWDVLGSASFWSTTTGRVLALKVIAVIVMVTIAAVHDFVLGPAASRSAPGTAESLRLRGRAAMIARFNALLGIAVLILAVRLTRG